MSEPIKFRDLVNYFSYLDALRESGKINMFGARPYLMDGFGLSCLDAAEVIKHWQETFDNATPPDMRAAIAFKELQPEKNNIHKPSTYKESNYE